MNGISEFFTRVLSSVFKLLLVMAAAVFVLSLLVAAMLVVLAVSVWSLITGRKPAPAAVFGRFRETSNRVTRGVWPNRNQPQGPGRPMGDVVDVQAHEVPEASGDGRRKPPDPGTEQAPRRDGL